MLYLTESPDCLPVSTSTFLLLPELPELSLPLLLPEEEDVFAFPLLVSLAFPERMSSSQLPEEEEDEELPPEEPPEDPPEDPLLTSLAAPLIELRSTAMSLSFLFPFAFPLRRVRRRRGVLFV